ncbi:SMI1/KNR4 family protein [Anatilimnocola floriformis]|uniref:SMI1/KNR4 family protein n=1 Tax=Anatilimnocola floriformis TaxID=2948575 RepID=UPI0020C535CE|nr:SMI1/KNR4 family protein [Anatilimnocola floriformis]
MDRSHLHFALVALASCIAGCGSRPAATGNPAGSANNAVTIASIAGVPAVTEAALQTLEKECGGRLPDDYRRFLLASNGGFPTPDCVMFTEAEHQTATDVFCFLAFDDQQAWASVKWHLQTFAGRLPAGTLPVARDSCGNLWLLSVTGPTTGSVYFWDHGSYATFDETSLANWPRVATSFDDFRGQLKVYDPATTNKAIISRYGMVQQAAEGMAKRDASFTTRGKPAFAWHCSCDDDGKVAVEFVKYEVHAMATHTDGYNRLLAQKGVIKGGQPRLPKWSSRLCYKRLMSLMRT